MSRDTTAIVVRTKGRNGSEAEYRNATVSWTDGMFEDADYPSANDRRVNRDWMLRVFHESRVYTDAWQAMKEADRDCVSGWAEYGVRIVDLSDIYFPASNRKRRQQRRFHRPRQEQPAAG